MSKFSAVASVGATGLLVLACTAIVASPAAAAPLDIPVTTPAGLVQAITDTNGNAGPDTIRVSGTLVLTVDLPEITDDLTILGDGSATTTIDGGGFQQTISTRGTAADPISVDISGLTVTHRGGLGGAIDARDTDLTLDDVVTSESYVGIALRDGSATVTNSTATGNDFAGVALHSVGGSVYSFTGMTLTENNSPGLQAILEGDARLTVTDSVSSGNGSSGIRIAGDEENGAAGVAVTIAGTTISANGADSVDGGGIRIQDPSGMAITLSDSTVSGNTADAGGGIYATFGGDNSLDLTIVNSTISGNTGGVVGGVHLNGEDPSGSHAAILNSTIVNNVTERIGPGLSLSSALPYEIRNTIVAGNIEGDDYEDTHYGDLNIFDPSLGTIDYSLIQDPHPSAGATIAAGTENLTGVDPKLGPLADNGGPTLTHLPRDDSPAVNAGDPAFSGLTADQRGQARVAGVLDMGAVEIQQPSLAATGADAVAPLAGGILLLGAGGLLLLARRRRSAR